MFKDSEIHKTLMLDFPSLVQERHTFQGCLIAGEIILNAPRLAYSYGFMRDSYIRKYLNICLPSLVKSEEFLINTTIIDKVIVNLTFNYLADLFNNFYYAKIYGRLFIYDAYASSFGIETFSGSDITDEKGIKGRVKINGFSIL